MRTFLKAGVGVLLLPAGLLALLYWWWPSLASWQLVRQLSAAGCDHVVVDLARPTWSGLAIPLLAFQTILGGERLTVTVEDARLDYSFSDLKTGRLNRAELPHVSIHLTPSGVRSEPRAEMAMPSPPILALEEMLRPLPVLPIREVALGAVAVRREERGGTIQEGTFGGTFRWEGARLRASLEVQEAGGRDFRVEADVAHLGDMAVSMESIAVDRRPAFAIRSRVQPAEAAMRVEGSLQADLHEIAPLLAAFIPFEGQLRQAVGRIRLEWTGTAPKSAPVDTLWWEDRTSLAASFQVEARLPEWNGVATAIEAKLGGVVAGNGRRVKWTMAPGLRLRATILPGVLSLPEWLCSGTGCGAPLRIESPSGLNGEAELTSSPLVLQGQGTILAHYDGEEESLVAEVSLSRAYWHGNSQQSAEGMMRLRGRAGGRVMGPLGVGKVRWDLAAALSLDSRSFHLTLQPASTIEASNLLLEPVSTPAVELIVHRAIQWTQMPDGGAWALGPGQVAVRLPTLTVAGTVVDLDAALVTLRQVKPQRPGWMGKAALQLTGLVPKLEGRNPPKTNWMVQASIESSTLQLRLDGATVDRLVTLRAAATHDLDNGAGQGRVELEPIRFDSMTRRLSALVTPWSHPLDVTGGTLTVEAAARWGPRELPAGSRSTGVPDGPLSKPTLRNATVSVGLESLAGQVKGYPFTGLTTAASLELTGGDRVSMPEPARVSIASLQTGVTLTDISAQVRLGWAGALTPAWADLHEFSTRVLGGRATSEGLRYEFSRYPQAFSVSLQRLQVQEILGLEQQKGLEGTGELDGTLPITLTELGVIIENGVIEARPPGGVIRYRGSDTATRAVVSSTAEMNLVLQPLSNFHYNVLRATVHYGRDGALRLETKLEGRNPDWQKGRPVNFNLNVEENLPALLESLELVQGIQKSIEQRFEPHANN